MKKQTKSKSKKQQFTAKPKTKLVKELADAFSDELNNKMPLAIQPDGSVVYKTFIVKKTPTGNWGLHHFGNKDMVDEFYLKTCAIMAAKAYYNVRLEKFFEIKRLDNKYWANYSDSLVYRKNIKSAKDFEKYVILLNRLEYSEEQTEIYKTQISSMFKWSFV